MGFGCERLSLLEAIALGFIIYLSINISSNWLNVFFCHMVYGEAKMGRV